MIFRSFAGPAANIRRAHAVHRVCGADRIFSARATATFRAGIVVANGSGLVALHEVLFHALADQGTN
jgi:hypothetical protein